MASDKDPNKKSNNGNLNKDDRAESQSELESLKNAMFIEFQEFDDEMEREELQSIQEGGDSESKADRRRSGMIGRIQASDSFKGSKRSGGGGKKGGRESQEGGDGGAKSSGPRVMTAMSFSASGSMTRMPSSYNNFSYVHQGSQPVYAQVIATLAAGFFASSDALAVTKGQSSGREQNFIAREIETGKEAVTGSGNQQSAPQEGYTLSGPGSPPNQPIVPEGRKTFLDATDIKDIELSKPEIKIPVLAKPEPDVQDPLPEPELEPEPEPDPVNEGPTDITLTALVVSENDLGPIVGALGAVDPTPGELFTYLISDARLIHDSGNLKVAPGVSFDFETTPFVNFSIQVTDVAGNTFVENFILIITNDNEAPFDIDLTSVSLNEESDGATVGILSTSDLDAVDSHTYLSSDARFITTGGVLKLAAGQTIDFETEPTINMNITTTDAGGLNFLKAFTINVVDVNEAPTDIAISNLTVAENAVAAVIGNVTGTDPDAGDSAALTYTVNDGRFEVVGGQLKLKAGQALDFETEPTVNITVTATDPGTLTYQEAFVITTTNVNENPTATANSNSIVEDAVAPVGGNVLTDDDGAGTDSDVDAGETALLTVSQMDAETNEANDVVGMYGTLDWGTNGTYSYSVDNGNATVQALAVGQSIDDIFTYTVRDPGGLTDTATLTITIDGANDAPTATANSNSIVEDAVAPVGGNVLTDDDGAGTDSDLDTGETALLTVSQMDAETNEANDVVGMYGTLDWGVNGSYSYSVDNGNATVQALNIGESLNDVFTYTVRDPAGLTDTETLTITIDGANDDPVATNNDVTVSENTAVTAGNMITDDDGHGTDSDVDNGATLTILSVNGETNAAVDVVNTITSTAYDQVWWTGDANKHFELDFSGASPVFSAVTNDSTNTEGGAVYTNPYSGDLLLYTDGNSLYNGQTHGLISNQLDGAPVATQSALIAPVPGVTDNSQFYVFTNGNDENFDGNFAISGGGVKYSVVDLTMGAHGTVTTLNADLNAGVSDGTFGEALGIMPHSNGTDYWILTFNDADVINAYLVNASGVSASPVASNTGLFAVSPQTSAIVHSEDYSKLAISYHNSTTFSHLSVADFDQTTGMVSNVDIIVPQTHIGYTTAFSPDGTKLYYTLGTEGMLGQVYQADITNPASPVITLLSGIAGYGGPKLAHDGKVYWAGDGHPFLGVVETPNLAATAPGFVFNATSFTIPGGDQSGYNLPNQSVGFASDLGTLDWAIDGSYTYTIDVNSTVINGLDVGESLVDTFTYVVQDEHGATDTATLEFTIDGVNDAPIATDNSNTILEGAGAPVSGNMRDDDDGSGVDSDPEGHNIKLTEIDGVVNDANDVIGDYGTLDWGDDGFYDYTVDNGNAAVIALADGESLTDTFTYTLADTSFLTDTADLVITINGVNDDPVAAADALTLRLGYYEDFSAAGPALPSGYTGVGDVESVQGYAGYGNGTYTFAGNFIHNDDATIPGQATTLSLADLAPHTSIDINFLAAIIDTWDGNDAPAQNGPDFFNVELDAVSLFDQSIHHISLSSGDFNPGTPAVIADMVELGFSAINGFGDTGFDMSGIANFTNVAHSANTLTIDWFADGAGWQGGVNESFGIDNVNLELSGFSDFIFDVLANDTDTDNGAVLTTQAKADTSGVLGLNYSINTAGQVTYENYYNHATVIALAAGDMIQDTLTYVVEDEHGATDAGSITIDIYGRNDAPVATDNTNSVVADNTGTIAGNVLTDDDGAGIDSDPDTGSSFITLGYVSAVESEFDVGDTVTGMYGSITAWGTDGSYTYDVDEGNATLQALLLGQSVIETFTYTLYDDFGGTDTATLDITINSAVTNTSISFNPEPELLDLDIDGGSNQDLSGGRQRTNYENWILDANSNIVDQYGNDISQFYPHVTIAGAGEGTADYYAFIQFTTGRAVLNLDAPGVEGAAVALYTSGGTLIQSSDTGIIDIDSLSSGQYRIGVSKDITDMNNGGNTPINSGFLDPGDDYTLHISSYQHPVVGQYVAVGGTGALIGPQILVDSNIFDTIQSATVSITNNYVNGEDSLFANNTFGGISQNFVAGTGILTLSGEASHDDYQKTLNEVAYGNSGGSNPNNNTRTVEIQINDGSTSSNTLSMDIEVFDDDSEPTDIVLSSNTVNENAVGAVIGDLTVTDVDDTAHTFLLSDNRFEIVGVNNTLQLKAGESLDYETETSVVINVRAFGSELSEYDEDMTINVNDITPEAPVISFKTDLTENDNDDTGGSNDVITFGGAQSLFTRYWSYDSNSSVVDSYGNDVSTFYPHMTVNGTGDGTADYYRFVQLDTGRFVASVESDVTGISMALYNASGTLIGSSDTGVLDIDSLTGGGGGVPYILGVSKDINDMNNGGTTPIDSGFLEAGDEYTLHVSSYKFPDANQYLSESFNTAALFGSRLELDAETTNLVGATVSITNNHVQAQDNLQAFTGTVGGIGDSYNSTSGVLTLSGTASLADYEETINRVLYENFAGTPTNNTREITVQVDDGTTLSTPFVFSFDVVADDLEPTDMTLSSLTVDENTAGGTVGDITVTDADDATHTFLVDDSRFEVTGVNNTLKLKSGEILDEETEPSIMINVRAFGSQNSEYGETFTVTVNDLNDAPVTEEDVVMASITTNSFYAEDFSGGTAPNFTGDFTLYAAGSFAGLGNDGNVFADNVIVHENENNPLTLTLSGLGAHDYISVRSLMATIDGWDGLGVTDDDLMVSVDTVTYFSETLDDYDPTDSTYGPLSELLPIVLLHNQDIFDQAGFPESAYDFTAEQDLLAIPHTSANLTVEWSMTATGREELMLDNVEIEGHSLSAFDVTPLTNDSDVEQSLNVSTFDATSKLGASITLNGVNTLNYDPNANGGTAAESLLSDLDNFDRFHYTASDGVGGTTEEEVIILGRNGIAGTGAGETINGNDAIDVIFSFDGDDTVNAGKSGDVIDTGKGINDIAYGEEGSDTFLFEMGDEGATFNGGFGAAWTDLIILENLSFQPSATLNGPNSWVLEVDGVAQTVAGGVNELFLGQDKDGVISIQGSDGTVETLTFDDVEQVKWNTTY